MGGVTGRYLHGGRGQTFGECDFHERLRLLSCLEWMT